MCIYNETNCSNYGSEECDHSGVTSCDPACHASRGPDVSALSRESLAVLVALQISAPIPKTEQELCDVINDLGLLGVPIETLRGMADGSLDN